MTNPVTEAGDGKLAHFPVAFFTVVMGMSGLTLALETGEAALGLTGAMSSVVYLVTLALFAMICGAYLAKLLRHRAMVVAEWNHPVKLAFFPAISISLLLLAVATLPWHAGVAEAVWLIGAGLQVVLTLAVISGWIGTRSFLQGHLTPAWFIPAVGNVVAPIAGAQLGYVELSWFFMAIGLIFWVVLLALVMNRLIFHDPLPERLQPTLVILIAPPAVGFLAWTGLVGGLDPFGRILINGAYLFVLIVAVQMPAMLRLPFALSFWALSFPVAAVTIASFRYADLAASPVHQLIGLVLLVILCLTLAALLLRTWRAVRSGAVFQPD